MKLKQLSAALTALAFCQAAPAAYINIDDSDPNTVTITAGDFEGGFSVNGNQITSGLGNSGSVTLADSAYNLSGSWIDLGQAANGFLGLYFALAGDPTSVTSGIALYSSSDGTWATLNGGSSFGAFFGITYFTTGDPTLVQNGQTGYGGLPYLSVEFTSESVPEPASVALVGLGLAGLGFARRQRRS